MFLYFSDGRYIKIDFTQKDYVKGQIIQNVPLYVKIKVKDSCGICVWYSFVNKSNLKRGLIVQHIDPFNLSWASQFCFQIFENCLVCNRTKWCHHHQSNVILFFSCSTVVGNIITTATPFIDFKSFELLDFWTCDVFGWNNVAYIQNYSFAYLFLFITV